MARHCPGTPCLLGPCVCSQGGLSACSRARVICKIISLKFHSWNTQPIFIRILCSGLHCEVPKHHRTHIQRVLLSLHFPAQRQGYGCGLGRGSHTNRLTCHCLTSFMQRQWLVTCSLALCSNVLGPSPFSTAKLLTIVDIQVVSKSRPRVTALAATRKCRWRPTVPCACLCVCRRNGCSLAQAPLGLGAPSLKCLWPC